MILSSQTHLLRRILNYLNDIDAIGYETIDLALEIILKREKSSLKSACTTTCSKNSPKCYKCNIER